MKLDSKYFDKIRVKPSAEKKAAETVPQCDWPDCPRPGRHKAPMGRGHEGKFYNYCTQHVQEYNKSYNYFAGMKDDEMAEFQKDARLGHRPTWKLGTNGKVWESSDMRSGSAASRARMRDAHGLFGHGANRNEASVRERRLKPLESKALETLGLDQRATAKDIKARYKELVKLHHPDANGGDRGSEERFRNVIQAYRLLKQAGFC